VDEFGETLKSIRGSISTEEGTRLRELAAGVTEGVIVEVGSWRGRSTYALSTGAKEGGNAPVFAIDPHEQFDGIFGGEFGPPDRRAFYRNMLRTGSWDNVRLVNLSSDVVTPGWTRPVGMLWIDGDHTYEGVKRDVDCWVPFLLPGAPLVLDDTTNRRGGPHRLIRELTAQAWSVVERIGKVAVLKADG
jgi:hypothetical protein